MIEFLKNYMTEILMITYAIISITISIIKICINKKTSTSLTNYEKIEELTKENKSQQEEIIKNLETLQTIINELKNK